MTNKNTGVLLLLLSLIVIIALNQKCTCIAVKSMQQQYKHPYATPGDLTPDILCKFSIID